MANPTPTAPQIPGVHRPTNAPGSNLPRTPPPMPSHDTPATPCPAPGKTC